MKSFYKIFIVVVAVLVCSAIFSVPQVWAGSRPEVEECYPEDNEKDVSLHVTIKVTFDEDMDEDDVEDEDKFTLKDDEGDEVDGNVTYDEDEREATFKPDDPLEYNTKYKVTLSSTIENEDGDNLKPYRWYFTTVKEIRMLVDGVEVVEDSISVNKSPVNIRLETSNAEKVIYDDEELREGSNGKFYMDSVLLEPGKNSLKFSAIYDDDQVVKVKKTINLVDTTERGSMVTLNLNDGKSFKFFNDRMKLELPKNYFLREGDNAAESQTLAIELTEIDKINNMPTVGYVFNIAPMPELDEYESYNMARIFDDFPKGISVPPGGEVIIPCDEELGEAAFDMVSVFFNPHDNIDALWLNLGGKTDKRNKTITVPFKGFGRYVAVRQVWAFSDLDDYEDNWQARPYIEYLWAKGIMYPFSDVPTTYFGLVDSQGKDMHINLGEFIAALARAKGLSVPDGYGSIGLINDLSAGNFSAYNKDGKVESVPLGEVKYIEAAAKNGFADGVRDSLGNFVFNYYDQITREQAAKIIARAGGLSVDLNNERYTLWNLSRRFKDYEEISPWAQSYVLETAKQSYFQAYDDWTFRPKEKVTRAEAAKLIYKLMEKQHLL